MTVKPPQFMERLFAAVAARRGRGFQWGVHDCCLFACDVIRDAGGVDYAAPFRGRYRTAAGAARSLKRFAGPAPGVGRRPGAPDISLLEAVIEKIAAARQRPEVPVLRAERGDLLLIDTELGPALAVCLGETLVAAGPTGTVLRPLAAARRAWRT